jgi:hypothetical protein
VTIPALLPPTEGPQSGSQTLFTPFQAVGARGTNNLASKLLLALLPPGEPFFRLTLDDFVVRELEQRAGAGGAQDARGEFEKALNRVERAILNRMEQVGVRTSLFETLKQLIVTGNALLFVGNRGMLRLYRLDEYVVKRDPSGEVLEIITKQMLSPTALPDKILPLIDQLPMEAEKRSAMETIPLFTWVKREGKKFTVHQEVQDKMVPDSEGSYPVSKTPWIPLRWTQIDNEDYGRGFAEEYIGDLLSLESLEQSLVEGAAAAAKVLFLVRPGSTTNKKRVAESPSGAIINGMADDITTMQLDKFADFQVAEKQAGKIERRLSAAFLLSGPTIREAERVTAEEIRLLAGELEDSLGGLYSLLSQELQLPLVMRIMHQMTRAKELPALPKEAVRPQIVTGLDALGRRRDLDKLDIFIDRATRLVGPENLPRFLNPGPILQRTGTALGIDMDGVVKSQEEIEAAVQQQQQAELMQQAAPETIKQIGSMVQQKGES